MLEIFIPKPLIAAIKFSAVEVFPNECAGCLVGSSSGGVYTVQAVTAYQNTIRTPRMVAYDRGVSDDFFGEAKLGDYHSHPNCSPTLSTHNGADLDNMEQDEIELVVGVWPSDRRGWSFRLRAYLKTSDKRYRVLRVRAIE